MRLLAGVLHSDEIVWNSYTWDADAHKQINTKIKINLEMLPNWNDVWSVSNHEFVIVHVVYNAGTAIGSPKQCYPYGILITVTSTTSVKNGWQNFQIFIEDTVNNGGETGNIFVRSNNASSSTWKKFSGTNIGIV